MTAIPKQTSALWAAHHFADWLREANPDIRSRVTVDSNVDFVTVTAAVPSWVCLDDLHVPEIPEQVKTVTGKTNTEMQCFDLTFLFTDDTPRHSTGNC